jgi:hypothetical protein
MTPEISLFPDPGLAVSASSEEHAENEWISTLDLQEKKGFPNFGLNKEGFKVILRIIQVNKHMFSWLGGGNLRNRRGFNNINKTFFEFSPNQGPLSVLFLTPKSIISLPVRTTSTPQVEERKICN